MFIKSIVYNPIEASHGVKLLFSEISPQENKISDIIGAARSNRVSSISLSSISRPLVSGEPFTIKAPVIVNGNIPLIDSSFLGTFRPSSIEATTVVFYQESSSDINSLNVVGDLYSVANISPREFYLIQFVIESIVPESAQVIISPSSYIIGGTESFSPVTSIQAKSLYSKSSKVLVKMLVRDVNTNATLKTEYIQFIVSDSSSSPCEIISPAPVEQSFIYLEKQNGWKYDYQGYRIAELITNNSKIIGKLVKKNNRLLPNRLDTNRVKIVVDPIAASNYNISIDQIRSSILNQYSTIQNSFALANLGNKSYDIVVNDVLLQPEDLNNLTIGKFPPVTGLDIKFNQVATSEPYEPDITSIPEVNLLRWINNGVTVYLGEIHFDSTIYLDSPIIIDYNEISLSGNLQKVMQGPNYLQEI